MKNMNQVIISEGKNGFITEGQKSSVVEFMRAVAQNDITRIKIATKELYDKYKMWGGVDENTKASRLNFSKIIKDEQGLNLIVKTVKIQGRPHKGILIDMSELRSKLNALP